jgi:hypothetical protein
MAVILMAPLLTLWIFFHRDRVVRLSVWTDFDVREALAMAGAGMCGRLTARGVMLAVLPRGKNGRLRLLRGCRKQDTDQPERSRCSHGNTSPRDGATTVPYEKP